MGRWGRKGMVKEECDGILGWLGGNDQYKGSRTGLVGLGQLVLREKEVGKRMWCLDVGCAIKF